LWHWNVKILFLVFTLYLPPPPPLGNSALLCGCSFYKKNSEGKAFASVKVH
jgi:hypothetical protein